MVERQAWNMASRTPYLLEHSFAVEDSLFDFAIVGDYSAWNRHYGLKKRDGCDIGASELINEAIAIWVGVYAETLGGLNPMVLVEGVVGKLSYRNHV